VDADWLTKPRQWTIGKILRLYSVYRADQFDLRLPDVLHDAVRFQLLAQPGPVPHRLVCGVALHPDVDHPCHSHQQDPVHPKPGQLAAHPHILDHRCGRRLAEVSPLANTLGFVPLPPRYWLFLAIMLLGYALLTQVVKTWFIRRFGE